MKSIDIKEILKGSGHSVKGGKGEVFQHIATSNGETIEILTKNEKVSLFLSSLHREDPGRFTIFKNLLEKTKKLGNPLALKEGGRVYLVNWSFNNEDDEAGGFWSMTIS